MVRIQRFGRRHLPFYRIVVADARSPRDGKFIEIIGTYDPKRKELTVKKDRLAYWLSQGAQITDPVKSLLSKYIREIEEEKTKEEGKGS